MYRLKKGNYSPVNTFPVSGPMRSPHEMRAFSEEVMTKRFTVGTLSAELRIPVVPLTAGSIISRS